jgi:hypothetical protein
MADKMTKEQFKKVVNTALETITSMPDNIWDEAYIMMAITFQGETVVIGTKANIEEETEEDEPKDAQP